MDALTKINIIPGGHFGRYLGFVSKDEAEIDESFKLLPTQYASTQRFFKHERVGCKEMMPILYSKEIERYHLLSAKTTGPEGVNLRTPFWH